MTYTEYLQQVQEDRQQSYKLDSDEYELPEGLFSEEYYDALLEDLAEQYSKILAAKHAEEGITKGCCDEVLRPISRVYQRHYDACTSRWDDDNF